MDIRSELEQTATNAQEVLEALQKIETLLEQAEKARQWRLENPLSVYDYPPEFSPQEALDVWLEGLHEYQFAPEYFYQDWHDEYVREWELRDFRHMLMRVGQWAKS